MERVQRYPGAGRDGIGARPEPPLGGYPRHAAITRRRARSGPPGGRARSPGRKRRETGGRRGGGRAERLTETRDRPVDGIDLAAAAGLEVEQHRRLRARQLSAEPGRTCSIGPPTSSVTPLAFATAIASSERPRATLQASSSARISPIVRPVHVRRPGERDVEDQLLPGHLLDVVEDREHRARRLPDGRRGAQARCGQPGERAEADRVQYPL